MPRNSEYRIPIRRHRDQVLSFALLWAAIFFPAGGFAQSTVRSLLRENLLDDALRICRQYEVLSTPDKDNRLACAWVYFRSDRIDSAEKILEETRTDMNLPEYQLLLAMEKIKHKQFDEAKKLAESVSREYRGSTVGLTAQELSAEIYEIQGQLDTAAFIYKQVVSDDPKRGRAHWGLGRYYLSRGDNGRARTHLELTANYWPKHVGSRFNLAVLALGDGNLPEAYRWLSECYRLDKADAGVLEQLGVVFEKKGMITDAIRWWKKAVEVKRDSPLAKEKLATYVTSTVDALIESKQWEEALKQMLLSEKQMASDPSYLLKRGMIYRNLGKWDKAASDLNVYTNNNPGDASGMRELGVCYLNLKLPDQAAGFFNKALTLEPTNGMNYAWLAYVLESKGKLEEARQAWTKALELLKEPKEVQRATRRLASVEARLQSKEQKKREKEKEDEE